MNIEQLLLTKEEVPIKYNTRFTIPIHPLLLDPKTTLDPHLGKKLFPQIVEEWYHDMQTQIEIEPDQQKIKWYQETFIPRQPKVISMHHIQYVTPLGIWEDQTGAKENGFIHYFSISRNAGGTLYYNNIESQGYPIGAKISKDKLEAYSIPNEPSKVYRYLHHNIDHFPGALFLRNWALAYVNAALQSLRNQKVDLNQKNKTHRKEQT